jgi:hypothetical protein
LIVAPINAALPKPTNTTPLIIPNKEIQSLLAINSQKGWEIVYNEYSPIMYGCILRLAEDQNLANLILIEVFRQLHDQRILLTTAPDGWRIRLITYSINIANRQLGAIKPELRGTNSTPPVLALDFKQD